MKEEEKLKKHSIQYENLFLERVGELRRASGQPELEITRRKRLESDMNHFFELSLDIFLIMDFDGYIIYANTAFEKILGYSKKEILAKSITAFVYPGESGPPNSEISKLIFDPSPAANNHIGCYRCSDGSCKWLEWNAAPACSEGLVYAVARDITARRAMEEELTKSNRQISNILTSITDAFYVLDNQWRFTYVNKEAQRLINVPAKELIGKNIWELWPEDIGRKIYREFHKAMREQVPVHFEERSAHSGHWFETHAYPSRDGLSVYSRYITERKQTEKQLQLNESRLKALVKLNQMAGATLKKVTDFVYKEGMRLTESAEGFLGLINEDETVLSTYAWSADVLNRCDLAEKPVLFPVESAGLWGEAVRQRRPIVVNDYAASPVKKGCPQGHVPLSRVMIIPVFEGGRIVMLAAVGNKKEDYNDSDVTQLELLMNGAWKIIRKKQVEEALRLSEERFYKAFNASPIAMTIMSLENNIIIDVNESFVKTFGYSRGDAIGRTALELGLWSDPEKRESMINLFYEQKKFCNLEVRARTRSGGERLLLASGEAITVNNEKSLLFVAQDITEYKQMEKEMARLDRLNLIGEMAASIGHEIRNPMTTVRGFLQILGEKQEFTHCKDYFDLMIKELDRANAIISEFLSLAKNKNVDLEKKNLNNIIHSLFPLIQADALKNDKQVEMELSHIPDFRLDEKEIRQLILNLVRNGLEATPQGKVLILKTFTDGRDVVMAVRDEGEGIPAEILEKIGTPFLSTKENGTGLGLAVCYSIAERHNAKIKIETSSGGTTFFVRFKIDQAEGL